MSSIVRRPSNLLQFNCLGLFGAVGWYLVHKGYAQRRRMKSIAPACLAMGRKDGKKPDALLRIDGLRRTSGTNDIES